MPILSPDELFYYVSRFARDFHGETVTLVAGINTPQQVLPVRETGISTAVRIYPGVDVTMRFNAPVVNTLEGAFLKADEYHTFEIPPGVDTIHFMSAATDSLHLTFLIGARS